MAKLKGTGLKLVGAVSKLSEYADHRCKVHGIVITQPKHVLTRLKKGIPVCPKCGTKSHWRALTASKREKGKSRYKTFFEDEYGRFGYRILGHYENAVTLLEHECPVHGSFSIMPSNVKQKHQRGHSCCPRCNLDRIRSTNRI
ncbi:hypothetical protein [Burkholderia phage BCSR5]|nr:hypothetical protein [Burkholderia phage BCSR5]